MVALMPKIGALCTSVAFTYLTPYSNTTITILQSETYIRTYVCVQNNVDKSNQAYVRK